MNKTKNFNVEEPRIKKVKTKFEDKHKDLDKYPKHILDLVDSQDDDDCDDQFDDYDINEDSSLLT